MGIESPCTSLHLDTSTGKKSFLFVDAIFSPPNLFIHAYCTYMYKVASASMHTLRHTLMIYIYICMCISIYICMYMHVNGYR